MLARTLLCRQVLLRPNQFSVRERRFKGFISNILENVKKEASKDEELSKSVQRLEERLTDVKENAALKSIKEGLNKVKQEVMESNQSAMKEIKEKAAKLHESTVKAGETISELAQPVKRLGKTIYENAPIDIEKIAQNKGVQKAAETIVKAQETIVDDSESYRYGGFASKEKRDELKAKRQNAMPDATERVIENKEAGSNIIMHKSSAWFKKWHDFKQDNLLVKGLFDIKRNYDESNNIVVYYLRSVTTALNDTFGSLFRENERAQVIKEIRSVDPDFEIECFLKEAREYIIPEIMDAMLKGDLKTLRSWLSEGVYNVFKSQSEIVLRSGTFLDGKVLDLRNVDIHTAKLLDDYPVLVLTFLTQQLRCVKDKTGKVVEGDPDKVEHVFYVWALAKLNDDTDKAITNGWKLVEMSSRDAHAF